MDVAYMDGAQMNVHLEVRREAASTINTYHGLIRKLIDGVHYLCSHDGLDGRGLDGRGLDGRKPGTATGGRVRSTHMSRTCPGRDREDVFGRTQAYNYHTGFKWT